MSVDMVININKNNNNINKNKRGNGNKRKSKDEKVELKTPLKLEDIRKLRCGDVVYISGEVITARDKAHMRFLEYIKDGRELPITLNRAVIYHCGPIVKKNGDWKVISAGPTTSARMNYFTPKILEKVECMAIIGKGGMNQEVVKALKGKGVYLAYTGGAGALSALKIRKVKGVYWQDLGMAEAIWVFEVEKFGPCIVGIDSHGNNLYEKIADEAEKRYKKLVESGLSLL